MKKTQENQLQRERRRARIRARIIGTAARPRLAIFRSNRYIYAQLIDDESRQTLASADSRTRTGEGARATAAAVGKAIAEAAKAKGIEAAVFDRGGFRYQGLVAALADGAREGGLAF